LAIRAMRGCLTQICRREPSATKPSLRMSSIRHRPSDDRLPLRSENRLARSGIMHQSRAAVASSLSRRLSACYLAHAQGIATECDRLRTCKSKNSGTTAAERWNRNPFASNPLMKTPKVMAVNKTERHDRCTPDAGRAMRGHARQGAAWAEGQARLAGVRVCCLSGGVVGVRSRIEPLLPRHRQSPRQRHASGSLSFGSTQKYAVSRQRQSRTKHFRR